MKNCIYCNQSIHELAVSCKYCKTDQYQENRVDDEKSNTHFVKNYGMPGLFAFSMVFIFSIKILAAIPDFHNMKLPWKKDFFIFLATTLLILTSAVFYLLKHKWARFTLLSLYIFAFIKGYFDFLSFYKYPVIFVAIILNTISLFYKKKKTK